VDPSTFGDDSLRVLRALQFAARFEFSLESETAALCRRIPSTTSAGRAHLGELEN
jgi:tRNA nucleotidyltransferase (CCA-adding enzyme)